MRPAHPFVFHKKSVLASLVPEDSDEGIRRTEATSQEERSEGQDTSRALVGVGWMDAWVPSPPPQGHGASVGVGVVSGQEQTG